MVWKITIRSTDTLFAKIVKERDNWICARCKIKYQRGSRGLENSHYWSRKHESTRLNMENCVAICTSCHALWGHGEERPQYEAFMKKRLGEDGFKKLDILAHGYKRRDDKLDMMYLKVLAVEYGLKSI